MVLNETVIRAALFHKFSGQLVLGTKLNVPSVIFTKLNTTSTVFAVTNSFMEVIMSFMVSMFCIKCFPDKIKSFCKTSGKKGKEKCRYPLFPIPPPIRRSSTEKQLRYSVDLEISTFYRNET